MTNRTSTLTASQPVTFSYVDTARVLCLINFLSLTPLPKPNFSIFFFNMVGVRKQNNFAGSFFSMFRPEYQSQGHVQQS